MPWPLSPPPSGKSACSSLVVTLLCSRLEWVSLGVVTWLELGAVAASCGAFSLLYQPVS